MQNTTTQWHEMYTDVVGDHPVAFAMWRPITSERAVMLLSKHGLHDRVRLGAPDFDAVAAKSAVLAEVHA